MAILDSSVTDERPDSTDNDAPESGREKFLRAPMRFSESVAGLLRVKPKPKPKPEDDNDREQPGD